MKYSNWISVIGLSGVLVFSLAASPAMAERGRDGGGHYPSYERYGHGDRRDSHSRGFSQFNRHDYRSHRQHHRHFRKHDRHLDYYRQGHHHRGHHSGHYRDSDDLYGALAIGALMGIIIRDY